MFTPSQADVRRFFCAVYAKTQSGHPLEALETIASQWLAEHPEYHAEFADAPAALEKMYDIKDGKTNPFLHLSMHMAIREQIAIDQPGGVRDAHQRLTQKLGSVMDAEHEMMDCLAEMIWQAQRYKLAPDAAIYLGCLTTKLTG